MNIKERARNCISDLLAEVERLENANQKIKDHAVHWYRYKADWHKSQDRIDELEHKNELAQLHTDKLTEGLSEKLKHEFERGLKYGIDSVSSLPHRIMFDEGYTRGTVEGRNAGLEEAAQLMEIQSQWVYSPDELAEKIRQRIKE